MAEPFLAEIRLFSFQFAPQGWAFCNGQLLPIMQNQALFSLLGTTYGGDGQTTFGIPDLRGRTPVHQGNGVALGQSDGEEVHVLFSAEMPSHTHTVRASSAPAVSKTPVNGVWATPAASGYSSAAPDTTMAPGAIKDSAGGQGHHNVQPYVTVNFCIALQGIFPSRN